MKNLLFWVGLSLLGLWAYPLAGQSVYAPLNQDYYHWVERYEVKRGQFAEGYHAQMKPFLRQSIVALADSTEHENPNLSRVDKFNLQYLRQDSWEWAADSTTGDSKHRPILKTFYRKQSDFYHVHTKDFDLHINPVLAVSGGYQQQGRNLPYVNTRGVELRGMIAKKVGFYSFLTDNQAVFPNYVLSQIGGLNAVPNEGYYKRDPGANKVDFLTARGYLSFAIVKNIITAQFGHDKNFIGHGYRSLVLSDFSSNYLFLKINTKVWKLNYQNLYAQMTAQVLPGDGYYPKKYFALHHLSINVTKNLNIGFFEAVVFGRSDSTVTTGTFDFNYLNPIIFFRSVEQQLGSPDNANLGMDFRWNFAKRFSIYGQLFVDELRVGEIRSRRGWWGNKQAWQIGFKYFDVFGLRNLDLQLEANFARPYTYTHNSPFRAYTNYNQPLAHPLGANFYEFIAIVRYQPTGRLNLVCKAIVAQQGRDDVTANTITNWGGNVFLDYRTFQQEYGNFIGQGVKTDILFLDFTASWQVKHNLFIDFKQTYRRLNSALPAFNQNTTFTALTVRWNIPQRVYAF